MAGAVGEADDEDIAGLERMLRGQRSSTPEVMLSAAAGLVEEVTPGLSPDRSLGPSASGGTQSARKGIFNIFKPAKERKLLTIIRHGESEYNRACSDNGSFKDPMIFDPHLTADGHRQAIALRSRIAESVRQHGSPLWVVSPLTRCLQTFTELVAGLDPEHKPQPHNIVVNRNIAEFMVTAGDVGRPTSELIRDFPQLSSQLSELPEKWWYSEKGRTSCAMSKVMDCYEPKAQHLKRVAEFTRWLNARPEKVVICVGHCSFWYQFLNKAHTRMANCESHTMFW